MLNELKKSFRKIKANQIAKEIVANPAAFSFAMERKTIQDILPALEELAKSYPCWLKAEKLNPYEVWIVVAKRGEVRSLVFPTETIVCFLREAALETLFEERKPEKAKKAFDRLYSF